MDDTACMVTVMRVVSVTHVDSAKCMDEKCDRQKQRFIELSRESRLQLVSCKIRNHVGDQRLHGNLRHTCKLQDSWGNPKLLEVEAFKRAKRRPDQYMVLPVSGSRLLRSTLH